MVLSKIGTLKEMIKALGENPEQLLTREALTRGNITESTIEDHQVGVLSDELKKLIRQSADIIQMFIRSSATGRIRTCEPLRERISHGALVKARS
jgi:hypothetical protein